MLGVAAHQQVLTALGDRGAALRAAGLVVLAVAAYLAITLPPAFKDQWRAREAQLAVAIYAVIVSVVAGVVGVVTALFSPGWFANDRLTEPSTLALVALISLLAAIVMLHSAKVTRRRVNIGAFMLFPAWVLAGWNAIMLAYFWFGPAGGTSGAQPTSTGTHIIEGLSFLVAGAAVVSVVAVFARDHDCHGILRRSSMAAGAGALVQIAIMALRAPDSWLSQQHLFGADLMISAAVIGAIVWATQLSWGKRVQYAERPHLSR
ncbi:MAG TPA: hypothetical protein VF898_13290 [Chloroflexota bacterium]